MRALIAVCGIALAACGGEGPASDGGMDAVAIDAETPILPIPPAPPAAPVAAAEVAITPCPDGWVEHAFAVGTGCEPFPAGELECAADEALFPGSTACQRLGAECPAGEFADDAPDDAIFVDDDATPGGDGSRAAPFATIGEAIDEARAGDVIALAKGRYEGEVRMPGGVRLFGACVRDTRLSSATDSAMSGVVRVAGRGAIVERVMIGPSPRMGVFVPAGGAGLLRDVVIEGVARAGIAAMDSSSLDAEGVAIRGVEAGPIGSAFPGFGLVAQFATVGLERVVVDRATTSGVVAIGGAVTGTRVAIVDTRYDPRSPSSLGVGLHAGYGAVVTLEESAVLRSNAIGVEASDPETRLALARSIVRDTTTDLDGGGSIGLEVREGATASVSRVSIENHRIFGIESTGGATTLHDVAVVGLLPSLAPLGTGSIGASLAIAAGAEGTIDGERVLVAEVERGDGIRADRGGIVHLADVHVHDSSPGSVSVLHGEVTIDRLRVTEARRVALVAVGVESHLALSDTRIEDIVVDEELGATHALEVIDGARVEIRRMAIEGASGTAMQIGTGATVLLEDLSTRDTLPSRDGAGGRVLEARGATVTLTRASMSGQSEVAVVIGEGATCDVADLSIADTASRASDGYGGTGLQAQSGGVVRGARVSILRSRLGGLFARDPGSLVTLSDVVVDEVRAPACGTCRESETALGIGAYLDAAVDVSAFTIARTALCGVQIGERGSVDLARGAITGNVVGVCVDVEGYDLDRLLSSVTFEGNESQVDARTLPVPEIAVPSQLFRSE